jgi:Cof subfamily protein (haloacid dehalogenase superfamily)
MRGRVIFLDFDGTIADEQALIPASAAEAITRARGNGHKVVLATGRSRRQLPEQLRDLNLDGMVTASGAFIEVGGELVMQQSIPESGVERLMQAFDDFDLEYLLQGYNDDFGSAGLFTRITMHNSAPDGGIPEPMRSEIAALVSHPATRRAEPVSKAMFVGADHHAFEQVSERLRDGFQVITGTMPFLGSSAGEVMLAGVHKGQAATLVLDRLGVSATEAVAVGDSTNDLEMFDVCGVSIAMGGASDVVKAHADRVTTTVRDDGLFLALEGEALI